MAAAYPIDIKRKVLAMAHNEGVSAASKQYGVAKNTIYKWKATMELNGLLEEDDSPANAANIAEAATDENGSIASPDSPIEPAQDDPAKQPDPDSSINITPNDEPAHQLPVANRTAMLPKANQQPPTAFDGMISESERAQMEAHLSRNRRILESVAANNPEIIAMILDENTRLKRENQQLRRAMRALVDL